MTKKIIYILISILVGFVFIFSGYAKLYPIEPFELNFIDQGVANWYTAPIIARGLIAVEFLLGLFLIFQIKHKKITLPATIALLVFFTFYLLWGIYKEGNKGNCGCFGTILEMTPLQSINKNILLIGFSLILYFFNYEFVMPFKKATAIFFIFLSAALPFILNPPDFYLSLNNLAETTNYTLPIKYMYDKKNPIDTNVIQSFTKDKKIVAFMSLRCPHCKVAAFKLELIHKKHPTWPITIILKGDSSDRKQFLDASKANSINKIYYNSDNFTKLSGPEVPIIIALNNGIVKSKISYINLKDTDIAKYIQ